MSKIIDQLDQIQNLDPPHDLKKSIVGQTPNWNEAPLKQKRVSPFTMKIIVSSFVVMTLGLTLQWVQKDKKSYKFIAPKTSARPAFAVNFKKQISKATLHMKAGEFELAITEWTQLKSALKRDASVLINLALAQKKTKDYVNAYKNLNMANQIKPNDTTILNNLGVLDIETNQLKKAIEKLKRAVNIQPENPDIHFNLASAYESNRQVPLAIFHYENFNKYSKNSKYQTQVEHRIQQLKLISESTEE